MRQPSGVGTPIAQRSASGSSAIAISASTSAASLQQRVDGAGLLRVGEGHRGEVRIGRELALDDVHVGEPGVHQRVQSRTHRPPRATASAPPAPTRCVVPDVGRTLDVVLNHLDAGRLARAVGDLVGVRAPRAMARSISRSVGGTIGNPPSKYTL